jgi:Fic family protein
MRRMYVPKFSITQRILKNIGLIEGSKEVIVNAPMVPAWEAKFREEAKLRMVHFGTKIEGNDLSYTDAEKVIAGQQDQVVGRERDIQEVINYRNVIDYLDELILGESGLDYTMEMLLRIHKLTTDKVIPDEESGQIRKVQVVLRNAMTGEVGYRPPPAVEVKYLLDDFIYWLNSAEGREVHAVMRAAVSHYVLTAIHPFVEGNGRTARAFATLVLFAEGYDTRKFFSLEEHFDLDAAGYFGKLMEVSNQTDEIENRELTPWVEYFVESLAIELSKIKEKVRNLSVDMKIKDRVGEQVFLSDRQIKLMEYLQAQKEMSMQAAKNLLPMISEDTILRDLKILMEKGIVKKEGVTKAAKYVLV